MHKLMRAASSVTKRLRLFVLTATCVAATSATAQTTWTGADGASLTTAGNWSSGLPSLISTGTIPGATLGIIFNSSVTNWVVAQDGGTVSAASFRQFNGGSWTMNGGSMTVPSNLQLTTSNDTNHIFTVNTGGTLNATGTTQVSSTGTGRTATLNISGGVVNATSGFNVNSGGTVNLSNGTLTNNSTLTINSGGSFSMTGGTRNGSVASVANSGTLLISAGSFTTAADRNLTTNVGGTTTISGGTVSINASIGDSLIGTGAYVFTGGTTTATGNIRPNSTDFSLTLGGTSLGSLTALGWHAPTSANRDVNWLSGTLMTMALSGAANWAETEWTANRMFYNGDSGLTLGLTWADVINPSVGFNAGGGTYFDWDSGTNTLALVTVPEPASLTAVSLVGLLVLARVRRHRGKP